MGKGKVAIPRFPHSLPSLRYAVLLVFSQIPAGKL